MPPCSASTSSRPARPGTGARVERRGASCRVSYGDAGRALAGAPTFAGGEYGRGRAFCPRRGRQDRDRARRLASQDHGPSRRRLQMTRYAISVARWTWFGTFVTGISRIGDGVLTLILSPRPSVVSAVPHLTSSLRGAERLDQPFHVLDHDGRWSVFRSLRAPVQPDCEPSPKLSAAGLRRAPESLSGPGRRGPDPGEEAPPGDLGPLMMLSLIHISEPT